MSSECRQRLHRKHPVVACDNVKATGKAPLAGDHTAPPLFSQFCRCHAFGPHMRIIVALAFVLFIARLASALYHMMRGKTADRKMVWSLTFRVGFSIALFVFI